MGLSPAKESSTVEGKVNEIACSSDRSAISEDDAADKRYLVPFRDLEKIRIKYVPGSKDCSIVSFFFPGRREWPVRSKKTINAFGWQRLKR